MTTYAPRAHVRRPHVDWRLAAGICVALAVAALAGYAIAGGFTTESTSPGQAVSDRVMNAFATGKAAAINAAYAPRVTFVLEYPGRPAGEVDTTRAQVAETIHNAIAFGNTYKQIGPVSSYTAADGDMYVASLVEVRGPGHPSGIPVVGFYRVHDGKVVGHVFMDAEHY